MHQFIGPWEKGCNLELVIFKQIKTIDILSIAGEIAPWSVPQDLIGVYSTLDQVMGWCRQATSHFHDTNHTKDNQLERFKHSCISF